MTEIEQMIPKISSKSSNVMEPSKKRQKYET